MDEDRDGSVHLPFGILFNLSPEPGKLGIGNAAISLCITDLEKEQRGSGGGVVFVHNVVAITVVPSGWRIDIPLKSPLHFLSNIIQR